MSSRHLALTLFIIGAAVAVFMPRPGQAETVETTKSIAQRMTDAHGGLARWHELQTIKVDRYHKFSHRDQPFVFDIVADYRTRQIYQQWREPPGEIVWDGERAWSVGWPLHERILPRYVVSIGFYLINLPWLVQDPAVRLTAVSRESGLPTSPDRDFIVLSIELEADSVRKPQSFDGPRDHFDLFIDPDTYLLSAVRQVRTYAGQLDAMQAPIEVTEISETYIPRNYVDVAGLKWPEYYDVYSLGGELAAQGRFSNYLFNQKIAESRFRMPHDGTAQYDDSSSFQRQISGTTE